MAGGSYFAICRLGGFFLVLWGAGKVSRLIGVSSIVFEITVGILLGPNGFKLPPSAYSTPESSLHDCDYAAVCADDSVADPMADNRTQFQMFIDECNDEGSYIEQHGCQYTELCLDFREKCDKSYIIEKYVDYPDCVKMQCVGHLSHDAQVYPDILTLIGQMGVSLMIFESGMHFDFSKVGIVGPKAMVFATLGTCLPIIAGVAYSYLLGYELWFDGIAAGVSLAPTSVGIALKLLLETQQLQTDFGQAIITGAFIDDILSLIAYGILLNIGTAETFEFQTAVLPGLLGIVFLIVGAIVAAKVFPKVVPQMLQYFSKDKGMSLEPYDAALLNVMVVTLLVYATISQLLGSHLWGCFIAGMSFTDVDRAHHAWVMQTKKLTSWMLRIFFGCTVAFAIPIKALLTVEAFSHGFGMGMIPCIACKVFCAPNMGAEKWLVGWAMVGRAEFAYLIAQNAYASGLMKDDMFAVVIWALLWATVLAPFCFRKILTRHAAMNNIDIANEVKPGSDHGSQGSGGKKASGEFASKKVSGSFAPTNADFGNFASLARKSQLGMIGKAGGTADPTTVARTASDPAMQVLAHPEKLDL